MRFSPLFLKDYVLTNSDAVYAKATKVKEHGIVKHECKIDETFTVNFIQIDDLDHLERYQSSSFKQFQFPSFEQITSILFLSRLSLMTKFPLMDRQIVL